VIGLKILQISPVFFPFFGGGVNVVRNISRELAKKHEVTVYTTTRYDLKHDVNPKKEYIDGYQVFYFRRNLRSFLGKQNISFDLMKAFQENLSNFDVIHIHSWGQFVDYVVCKYASKSNVPYVLHVHGTFRKSKKRARMLLYELVYGKKFLRNASRVIAISHTEAKQLLGLGVPNERINIVHNGFDEELYSKLPLSGGFKQKFKIGEETNLILYLGRVESTKGIDFLVKAFAYAIRTLGLKNVKLAICGPDFGFLSKVRALVGHYGISEKVLIGGILSEKDKLLAYVDADLVVYPEVFNVWGLVVVEAAACGKPVIVSETNHMANIVKKGKFGFTIKYGDVKSFAKLLEAVLVDEKVLKKMGSAGKKFVNDHFSWQSSVQKLEKIYSEVIPKRN